VGKTKKHGTAKKEVQQKPQMARVTIRNRIASHFTNLLKTFQPTKADALFAIAWFVADFVCHIEFGVAGATQEHVVMSIRGTAAEFIAAFSAQVDANIKFLTEPEAEDGKSK